MATVPLADVAQGRYATPVLLSPPKCDVFALPSPPPLPTHATISLSNHECARMVRCLALLLRLCFLTIPWSPSALRGVLGACKLHHGANLRYHVGAGAEQNPLWNSR